MLRVVLKEPKGVSGSRDEEGELSLPEGHLDPENFAQWALRSAAARLARSSGRLHNPELGRSQVFVAYEPSGQKVRTRASCGAACVFYTSLPA